LGIGLSALLSGAEHYYGLDVVKHTNNERNVKIFEELIELFAKKAEIPGGQEFPNIFPLLDDYSFPENILTPEVLAQSLRPQRLEEIRRELKAPAPAGGGFINYFVPWDDSKVIQPGSVDFIFSQFVLEHVNDLDLTYSSLQKWLKPSGLMSHMIDFRSHGTAPKWNGHWAYSNFVWKMVKGGRPFLLNREPASAHQALLKKYNFKTIRQTDYERTDGISRSELDEKFKNLTSQDLTVWGSFIQARL
jgi:hypothetical protein